MLFSEADEVSKDGSATSYKEVLRESAGTLIDCLVVKPEILAYLERSSVFNQEMSSKVLCRPNRPDKVRVLLGFLMNLGPHSLRAFIEALQENNQHFLANILAAQEFT